MNADRFNGLNPEQQEILRRATATAVKPALEVARADEAHAGSGLCIVGMNVMMATASDLAALRDAVQPVYAHLEQDPETNVFLAEILLLKAQAATEPRVVRMLARANRWSLGTHAVRWRVRGDTLGRGRAKRRRSESDPSELRGVHLRVRSGSIRLHSAKRRGMYVAVRDLRRRP